ncbi:MAG: leucine-rich repeat protein [Lachnospiraceae bacterium]|nr:leucine-rich repeat protein [Lachnospiraceae bacterium]
MNQRKKKKVSVLAVLVTFTTLMSGCNGCAGCNENTKPVATTPTIGVTATTAPTATVAPTVTAPVVTEEPQYTPTTIPDTPTPVPTETPTPSPVPTPTLTPTPEPTATPVPTNTPTPVVKVDEKAKLLGTVKMGDNVWYDYYDDETLVVRGKGKTKDLKEYYEVDAMFTREVSGLYVGDATTIIIEEGITELGKNSLAGFVSVEKVIFPSSLKKIGGTALAAVGCYAEETDYIGLDLTRVKVSSTAFSCCGSPENVEGLKDYTALPTPTPAPTATPTPNPSKPRVYDTRKMGKNVTFEFVDNGYLYIKGTGATYDKDWTFFDFEKEPYCNTHTVIVEEGVTYLGDFALQGVYRVKYFQLPKSLTNVGYNVGSGENAVIDAYYEGKPITVKAGTADNPHIGPYTFFRVIKDVDKAIADGYEIIFR